MAGLMSSTSFLQANGDQGGANGAPPPPPPQAVPTPAAAPVAASAPAAAAPATKPAQAQPSAGAALLSDAEMSARVDKTFKGTPLEGQWPAIKNVAQKRNLDPYLMLGVVAHETGKGGNVRYNNPGGIMDPATNWQKKMQFNTIDEGLDYTAATIARNLRRANGNMVDLAKIYAPVGASNDPYKQNQYWLSGVQGYMRDFSRP